MLKCFLLATVLILPVACTTPTTTNTTSDPLVLLDTSIGWYTGAAGHIDDELARDLLEQAADSGHVLAVMWLARVYSTGRMTFPRDKDLAIAIAETVITPVEQLANSGNAEAAFLMGTAFAEGLAKTEDAETAITWYLVAAEQGHMLAQHNLGNAYAAGRGVPQDDSLAVTWWRLAAQAGDAIPQFMLGGMYEQGRGLEPDRQIALYWYSQAAERGYLRAVESLQRLQELAQ